MEQKIKNILSEELNKIKDLKSLDEAFNEISSIYNARKEYLGMLNEAAKLSDKNFGFIKEAFEELSPELYRTNQGKTIIKKYIDGVKSNKALSQMYSIYENVCHTPKEANEAYILQNFIDGPVDKKEYAKGCQKAGAILAEAYIALDGKFDFSTIKENVELNEAIDYLATSKRSLKNMAQDSVKIGMVQSFIAENKGSKTRQKVAKNGNLDKILESFNERYANSEFAGLIKDVAKDNGTLFEEYKNKCLSTIKETLDANPNHIDADRLHEIYEAIEKKSFNKETIGKDIANFIDLTEIVK